MNEPTREQLLAVYKVARELVSVPPYPWDAQRKQTLLRRLASKVNDIDHPLKETT